MGEVQREKLLVIIGPTAVWKDEVLRYQSCKALNGVKYYGIHADSIERCILELQRYKTEMRRIPHYIWSI